MSKSKSKHRSASLNSIAVLPSPLLHPMEEREKSRSLMQPCIQTPRRLRHATNGRLPAFALKGQVRTLPLLTPVLDTDTDYPTNYE